MEDIWQVCSLLVQAKGQRISEIGDALNGLPGCDVAWCDVEKGALIVVVEAANGNTLLETIRSVRNAAGVLAVSLVYHQQDDQGEDTP